VLAAVGHGGLREAQIVNRMQEEYRKEHQQKVTDEQILGDVAESQEKSDAKKTGPQKSGIVVKGLTDVAVHFSKCCSPVPGDEIVGFVTRGRGVSIHRTDCVNIIQLPELDRERLIDAEWQQGSAEEENGGGRYLAEIKIFGNNRTGLLVDISKIFTERGIDIQSINSRTNKKGIATISISFYTKGKDELSTLIEKVRQVDSIFDIKRTTG
jgi:GTP pyrophosphokinase